MNITFSSNLMAFGRTQNTKTANLSDNTITVPVSNRHLSVLSKNIAFERTPKSDVITFAGKTPVSSSEETEAALEVEAVVKSAKAMQANAENMADRAFKLAEIVQKKVDTVVELFKNGGKDADGKVVAKISYNTDDYSEKIMEEFADDGKTVRKSVFKDSILQSVEEYSKDGTNTITLTPDGNLRYYTEGVKHGDDGSVTTARSLDFDGRAACCYQGIQNCGDGVEIISKNFHFDGRPYYYYEGIKNCADGVEIIAKSLDLYDGKVDSYREDCEYSKGIEKIAKSIGFHEGKPIYYREGIEFGKKCKKELLFNKGVSYRYYKGE